VGGFNDPIGESALEVSDFVDEKMKFIGTGAPHASRESALASSRDTLAKLFHRKY
jgi:hypothetical protein